MKKLMLLLSFFIAIRGWGQSDSLPSAVYSWSNSPVKKGGGRESRQLLQGRTTDLSGLKIHTSTLPPGQTNHPLQAYNDREELILVKEGSLTVTLNDSTRTLGQGSAILIVAGDRQSFRNDSDSPATYCVLAFRTEKGPDLERGRKSGGSLMKDWNELAVKKTAKGESRPVFDRPTSLFERFEMHVTALDPGFDSHPPHTHRAEEIMLLLKGTVTVNIGGRKHPAAPGDVILLRPEVPHNLVNTGKEQCRYFALKWFPDEKK